MIFYLDASAVVAPLRSRVTAADFIARLTRKHKNRTIWCDFVVFYRENSLKTDYFVTLCFDVKINTQDLTYER